MQTMKQVLIFEVKYRLKNWFVGLRLNNFAFRQNQMFLRMFLNGFLH